MPISRSKETRPRKRSHPASGKGSQPMHKPVEARQLDEPERVVLLSVGALGSAPLPGEIVLQKLHFLLANAFPDLGRLYRYRPGNLGPHSKVVEVSIESLISSGLVGRSGRSFVLTDAGGSAFSELHMEPGLTGAVDDFKEFLNDLPDDEILLFTFIFYPEFIGDPAKWEELRHRRKDVAVSLLEKGKISFSKALEMSGMDGAAFINVLKERGVRWRAC